MLKISKTVAPTPFKNIHCDGAHYSARRGPQGRGQGPNMKMVKIVRMVKWQLTGNRPIHTCTTAELVL